MSEKPTYEELLQKIKELEREKYAWSKGYAVEAGDFGSGGMESLENLKYPLEEEGSLGDIIDVSGLQSIMDDFYNLTGMVTAILDINGKVIEATGWQDICTKFHRACPETARHCTESDLYLVNNIKPGDYIEYQCKNGLWDVVTPLYIGGKHLGNIYTGQFFYHDDLVDEKRFIQQAEVYGFDKEAYLDALHRVPKFSREVIKYLMGFLAKFTSYISNVSYTKILLEREIFNRKLAEVMLRENEARYRNIIEHLPQRIFIKDCNSVYLSCNHNFAKDVGIAPDKIVGMDDFALFPKELADKYRSDDHDVVSRGHIITTEELYVVSGEERWVHTSKIPYRDNNGKVIGVLGIFNDITDRKQAEEARISNEKRLQAILEASADAVVAYDDQGNTTFVNPAFTRLFGWEPEEVLGRKIPFVPEDQIGLTQETIHQLYENGKTVSLPTKRLTKDGRMLDIVVHTAGIQDATGKMSGMVVNLTDVSHTKQLEAQLHQAQKMEAIGTLAGGIAHDFNNILGAVIGYSEMARDLAREKQDPIPDINEVIRAGERARDLVKQILTFSRKVEVDLKPLYLNDEAKRAIGLLGRTIPKMIAIQTQLAGDLKPVQANANQIEQILLNLGSNAQDAMPDGGRLVIETRNVTLDHEFCMQHLEIRPGEYVLLQVSDTGVGMDEQTREHIFDPFFTTKMVGKGTGLGLSTVYGIVKGFGGHIFCDSAPGLGTTFKIYLPAYLQDIPISFEASQQPHELSGGKETILLVDDEEALRIFGARTLSNAGYRVLIASSGEEAITLYKEQRDDIGLVILDLGMMGMGGHKALQAILEINPQAKVMIASGYAANAQVKAAMESGATGYVAKPFKKAELLAIVRSVLDKN